MRKWLARIGLGLVAALFLVVAGFALWALTPPAPEPEAMVALASAERTNGWWVYRPPGQAQTGLIFYPGGRVDPRAYAPYMKAIAAEGYLVVVPPEPFNMAIFAPNKAEAVMRAFPEIQNWVLGGHSLGGTTAAIFVHSHPEVVRGALFWAAYPTESSSLKDVAIPVTSIRGTNDGLVSATDIAESLSFLPADLKVVEIPGGNHAQFGYYGPQTGDNPPATSHAEQLRQTVKATVELLEAASTRK